MRLAMVAMRSHNALYRAFNPALELTKRGHDVRYGIEDELEHPAVLASFDAVLLYRVHSERAVRVARWLREHGVAVIWDNDDLLHGVERTHTNYKRVGGLRGERLFGRIREMLRCAHVVTTPSPVLAELYERSGADRALVIENYLPNDFAVVDRPRRACLTIGWVAAMEHKSDADRLRITPLLERLLARHANLRIATVGLRLGLPDDRYEVKRFVPFGELPDAIAAFDIGIAPLSVSTFNMSRSNVKVKEYAALGVPWLASPIGPYVGMGEQQGGRLVPDDRWEVELEALIANERLRRRLGKWAASQTVAKQAHRWESAFAMAIQAARETPVSAAGSAR
jgi:glycosyltransferase involved in cell wall biosynthesis